MPKNSKEENINKKLDAIIKEQKEIQAQLSTIIMTINEFDITPSTNETDLTQVYKGLAMIIKTLKVIASNTNNKNTILEKNGNL